MSDSFRPSEIYKTNWNLRAWLFLVLFFSGLFVASKIWPGETPEQLEQERQREFRALDKAIGKCQSEFGENSYFGDDVYFGTDDFKDCVEYRMKVYHRRQKLKKETDKMIEISRKRHPDEPLTPAENQVLEQLKHTFEESDLWKAKKRCEDVANSKLFEACVEIERKRISDDVP